MEKVNGTFYTAERLRRGTTPVSPPYDGSEGQQPPVNPSVKVTPPVAIRYASEAAMIADQNNQRSGYLYFDGTNTWWYLGVANGVIGDYQEFGSTSSYSELPFQVVTTSGSITDLVITSNRIVFTGTNPILNGMTGGVDGKTVEILFRGTGRLIFTTSGTGLNQFFPSAVNVLSSGASCGVVYENGYWWANYPIGSVLNLKYTSNLQNIESKVGINRTFIAGGGSLLVAPTLGSNRCIDIYDSAGNLTAWLRDNGQVFHARSSVGTQSIRRDEQRLFYVVSDTVTSGTINNKALTDGIFNYRFTLATTITGFSNGEIGKSIIIQNDNTVNLDLTHEDVSSIAANRMNLIGGATLSIPTKGKVTLIYCTGNRWELLSKNF